ncbi:MAG TPA: alpha/beta hydrolase [Chryseolinea sp.]|nr:alpha/beta hydrolase [Chryseolinea sp.]
MGRLLKSIGIVAFVLLVLFLLGNRKFIALEELEKEYFTRESRYIQLSDAKVHTRIKGNGPYLFLLHGSLASLHTWKAWEDSLGKSFTTISFDFPGHGLTGPNTSENYSINQYEKLLFELADSLDVDTFSIAGNSMGGQVAWQAALHRPDRVSKLILIDAVGFITAAGDKHQNNAPLIFKLLRSEHASFAFEHITCRWMFSLNMKKVYANPDLITPQLIDRYFQLMLRQGNRHATWLRLQQLRNPPIDSLSFITVPTLILWGEKDEWINVESAYQFNNAIKRSKIVTIPEAGHTPMEESPNESLPPVLDFLKE